MLFFISWWKVLASIDFVVMDSSDDATYIGVDSAAKEKRDSEDSLAALIKENSQLILIKYFADLAKNNSPTKEREAPCYLLSLRWFFLEE